MAARVARLFASFKHLLQYTHQGTVFQGSCNPLFVSELLIHLFIGAVGTLLDTHVHAEARRQGLLEPHAHAQANDGRQGAMGDCRRDLNDNGADGRKRGGGREDVDVWQVDHGEGAERERMLRIGDGGDEVCHATGQRGCWWTGQAHGWWWACAPNISCSSMPSTASSSESLAESGSSNGSLR
jgi:hypothetical protein